MKFFAEHLRGCGRLSRQKRDLRVAERYGLKVTLVANSWMNHPRGVDVELVVVEKDRSLFLQKLDELVNAVKRGR